MASESIHFNKEQFNILFPFYIEIDSSLQIIAFGHSFEKLYGNCTHFNFTQRFAISRPYSIINTFEELKKLQNQLLVIDSANKNEPQLRGQLQFLPGNETVFFVGSPWFRSVEEIVSKSLYIYDFAPHDPQIDLLHLLKAQEIRSDDLKELAENANRQKNELKKANAEIQDIALFPMQSPDPIIRINYNGDILRNNPAASVLDFLEYENNYYRNDQLFKIVAEKSKHTTTKWTFEATSDDKAYSFLCIPMPKEGYVNIYARDITRQKEDQIQMERLSKVASANTNGVLFTTEWGTIFWCNEGMEKLTGYSIDEIIGKTPVELLRGPLTDKNKLSQLIDDVIYKRSFNNEMIHYRKDGSWYWAKTKGQPVLNNDGRTTYFAIIEDITVNKEKEEQLRVLSSIAAENTHGVVIADPNGCVEWVNKSFENITGYSLDEIKGKKPGQVLQGKDTDTKTVEYIREQIKNGEPFVCEILNYHKSGSTYWLRLQGQALKDKAGNILKFFAIEEDITKEKLLAEQLREFEQKFRLALEKIGDNVWEHDFRTGITQFSKSENNLLTIQKGEEHLIDKLWWNSIYKEDVGKVQEIDDLYKQGKINHHHLEYRIVQPDGSVKWVLDRGVVLEKNRENKPQLIVGTHTDITNQKTIEQQLTQAKNDAELSQKSKEVFLANMSHEIRTPLNAILGMANQLRKSKLSEHQLFQLETINTAAENLLVIINDILDLSKIEAGKLSVEKIGFEPKKVVTHSMQVLMHKAEEKGLSLTNSFCDRKLWPVLIGDPYRLNQVLLNLMSNAVKFTEHGAIDIRCRVISDLPDTQIIEASVEDTGIGMDEEYVSRLFEKFSQEYESVSRKFGGTGLGMSICKELVELMGGEIEVESEKGKGTCVTFRIPFLKGSAKDIPSPVEENISDNFLSGKNILVADDNEMNRLVATTILESYGAKVVNVTNGEEACQTILSNKDLHLVLMDIQMPIMNGYMATQKIREAGIKTPIIALTANAIRGENEKCLNAGMNDFIAKPFKEELFLRKIAHWLNKEMAHIRIQLAATQQAEIEDAAKLYSLEGLKTISQGNAAFVKKMAQLFYLQVPLSVSEMKKAFEENELEKMGAIAHKIKPSIDNLYITSLKQIIRDIEKAGKENKQTPELSANIEFVHHTINTIVTQLQKEFPTTA
ncbi:MAG: Autoinducer 2 sensor kinase/phosphatase LuxQ [Bacteroidota bacterium]|jgi:PAS domain S-box-containing protein